MRRGHLDGRKLWKGAIQWVIDCFDCVRLVG